MISRLITQPQPQSSESVRSGRGMKQAEVPSGKSAQRSNASDCVEDRYIVKLVLLMLLVLVLPAVLMLLYIVFNLNAFQYDIIPK